MGESFKGDNFSAAPRLIGVFGSDDDTGSGFERLFIMDVYAEGPTVVMGAEVPRCGSCDHAD